MRKLFQRDVIATEGKTVDPRTLPHDASGSPTDYISRKRGVSAKLPPLISLRGNKDGRSESSPFVQTTVINTVYCHQSCQKQRDHFVVAVPIAVLEPLSCAAGQLLS